MASSSTEFYNWLIRVTTLIRAQQDPEEQELFKIFCRELGQVLQFDSLAKYDGASNTFTWFAGPEFEELNEELKTSAGRPGSPAWLPVVSDRPLARAATRLPRETEFRR